MLTIIINAFEETLSMVLISGIFAVLFGLPIGVLLYGSTSKQFFPNKILHYTLRLPIALLNSIPYLTIAIFCIPLLKLLTTHNTIDMVDAILPLTLAAIPCYSLLTFNAIKKLPTELSETIQTLGATPWQALIKIYLPEILPALVQAIANTLTQLVSFSTVIGVFGAGGIGTLMMQKGYHASEYNYIVVCALLLAITIQSIQFLGNKLAKQIARQ